MNASPFPDFGFLAADRSTPRLVEIATVLLFTESLASEGDDRRGWWADTYDDTGSLGSTIWTFAGAPLSTDVLRGIELAAEVALASLLADGLASSICATATRRGGQGGSDTVDLSVEVVEPDGATQTITWPDLWAELRS